MSEPVRYFHGGVPGLTAGDRLLPHPPRIHPGCAECEARAAGVQIRLPDGRLSEPPTARPDRVYVTTHRLYARWYASRSYLGTLYEVELEGDVERSVEDFFPTFIAASAVVTRVIDTTVRLTPKERRRLAREWDLAEAAARQERMGIPSQLIRR